MAQLATDPCCDVTVSMTQEYMHLHRPLTPRKSGAKYQRARCVSGVHGVALLGGTGLPKTGAEREVTERHTPSHTPSIAFRHLPPNFARFSYATERALFISAQLSTNAVSALRKVQVLIKPVLNWANVSSRT